MTSNLSCAAMLSTPVDNLGSRCPTATIAVLTMPVCNRQCRFLQSAIRSLPGRRADLNFNGEGLERKSANFSARLHNAHISQFRSELQSATSRLSFSNPTWPDALLGSGGHWLPCIGSGSEQLKTLAEIELRKLT